MIEFKSRILFLIYKTLIMDHGISAVERVFSDINIVIKKKKLSFSELCDHLYNDSLPHIPFEKAIEIFNNVEKFLKEHNVSFKEFLISLLHKRTTTFLVSSGRDVLKVLEPYLDQVYTDKDPRFFIVNMANHMHRAHVPQSFMHSVYQNRQQTEVTSILEVMYDSDNFEKYAYNIDPWKGFLIREAPRAIGAPPFDSVEVIADCRSIKSIVGKSHCSVSGNEFMIDNTIAGEVMSYRDFILQQNIDPKNIKGDLDTIGVKTSIEYGTKENDYPTLRKDSFYGSPSNLMVAKFNIVKNESTRFLKDIVKSTFIEEEPAEEIFAKRHDQIMKKYSSAMNITYYKDQQKIFTNDRPLFRAMPAELFAYFCEEFIAGKTTPHEYQEIAILPRFEKMFNAIKPNIDVRIRRIKEKLLDECPEFEIKMLDRGKFSFHCKGEIDLIVK